MGPDKWQCLVSEHPKERPLKRLIVMEKGNQDNVREREIVGKKKRERVSE